MAKVFQEKLDAAEKSAGSLVCVGLDPDISKFPAHLRALPPGEAIVEFNRQIIDATHDLVSCYKPNFGFYIQYGLEGLAALIDTRRMIPAGIPVILDCKVGDISTTAEAYAKGFFDEWDFDCITVNAYLGEDAVAPFVEYPDRGVLVLAKTSNRGSGDLQDLKVTNGRETETVYEVMAKRVSHWNERYPAAIGLVVGATYPDQMARVRALNPWAPILVPGIGAQGGDVAASVKAGLSFNKGSLLMSSSRGIIYASRESDFADAARNATVKLRDEINAARS